MRNVPDLAVVSIFKDEAPYLDEWLQFHRAQGVAHFYLYNNGSTDDSRQIATDRGARVVPVPTRGYGAALRGGIEAAEGKYVMFADADGTYFYENSLELYQTTSKADADMGIASRMKGVIEPGAMPTLHRILGTPVLTGLINLLFKGKLSDCNSGFRCLKKTAYQTWDIRASGMEFASELLINPNLGLSPVATPQQFWTLMAVVNIGLYVGGSVLIFSKLGKGDPIRHLAA